MRKPVFYLDLDRTIFRTDQIAKFFPVLERLYPENSAIRTAYETRESYHVFPHLEEGDRKTYYYDLTSQLEQAGLDARQVFSQLHDTELSDGRFEYDGAEELVQILKARGEVKVLTYGEEIYQKFKASLCPSLRGLEVITTVELKVKYLNEHSTARDWIIDDKVINGIRTGMHVLHILHDTSKPAQTHSLTEVAELIRVAMPLHVGK
jgi:hypothetical protein